MFDDCGRIVRSEAGHDKGKLFCVVGVDGTFLLLADGKRRSVAKPKRKKCGHMSQEAAFDHPVLTKLRTGEKATDRELREALAAFRDRGGN